MERTTRQLVMRSLAAIALLAGGLQLLLDGYALWAAVTMAGKAGLTSPGWLGGLVVPAAHLVAVCLALWAASRLFLAAGGRRAVVALAACLLLQMLLSGFLSFLFWLEGRGGPPAQWFVTDYRALPPNEIFGPSGEVVMGSYLPIVFSGMLGAFILVLTAVVLLLPIGRQASATPSEPSEPAERG